MMLTYFHHTWLGRLLRSIHPIVTTRFMVVIAATLAILVVSTKIRRMKPVPGTIEELVTDDVVFGGAYAAATGVVCVVVLGLCVWPLLAGTVPKVALIGAFGSVIGVWVSIVFDRIIRVSESSRVLARSRTYKEMSLRMMYLHATTGFLVACAITAIPFCCPYDAGSLVYEMIMRREIEAVAAGVRAAAAVQEGLERIALPQKNGISTPPLGSIQVG
jgi:hypothetical protein